MIKKNRAATFSTPIKLAVTLILLLLVIVPIIRMFSGVKASDFQKVFSHVLFPEAVKNSVVLSLTATLISVLLAYILALCIVRTNIPGKKVFGILLTLPMLIPSISHGIGLTTLFGNNGLVTQLFKTPAIYGPVGIVTGSVMYAFPVAYIMLADVLKYEDLSVYEAADILGISKTRQFFRLSLPYMSKPLLATIFSTFSMIVTDYGVPLSIGGKTVTLSTRMYTEIAAATGGDFGESIVYALCLLVPAIIAFAADAINKEKGTLSFVKASSHTKTAPAVRVVAFVMCCLVSFMALLPILSFAVQAFVVSYPKDMTFTFSQVQHTIEKRGLEFLKNSLVIALITATLGTVLSYITAYLTARMRSPLSRLMHLLVLTFMAVPGLVLGLSYAMTFKGTLIYGTIVIMTMANTAHFMASPYLMMYNSFGKMNENLESVGQTLGLSRIRMLKDVFIPQNISTLAEMFSYLFVNSMMTISAVSFLFSSKTRPISLLISQFNSGVGGIELAAVVSLMILLVNLLMKGLIGLIKMLAEAKKKRGKETVHDTLKKAI